MYLLLRLIRLFENRSILKASGESLSLGWLSVGDRRSAYHVVDARASFFCYARRKTQPGHKLNHLQHGQFTHPCTPTHPHPHTSTHPHIHTSTHPHIHTSTHPHIHTSTHPHIHTSTHPHIHTSTHPHIHTSTHPHIHTSTPPHRHTHPHTHQHPRTPDPHLKQTNAENSYQHQPALLL